MAVDVYTYGTVAGVHRRVGWVVEGRQNFGSNTVPSLNEVTAFLDQVASQIHAKLTEAGYPISTKTAVTLAAPRAVSWLEALNEAGACLEILQMFPIANDPESGQSNPAATYKSLFNSGLKMINGVFLDRLGLSRSYEQSDHLVCTSVNDGDGNEKKPMFKRGMFSYPGVSGLVEDDEE